MINSQYRSVITSAGHTANTQSIASGTTIVFDEIAFGSGGLVPNENATGLIKEELRIKIHSVVQNQTDTNILEIEAVVPAHIGGFTINEAALYLDDGTLYAVASLPESYKPILDQGAGKEFSFVFFLASVGVENVALTIDGGASFVTTNYFQNELKKYAFVIGDETKKFKVADAENENEAVNKKQIDELESRLNDSIETINDSIETLNDSVSKNTTTAVSGITSSLANPVTGIFGTGKINFYVSDDTFIVPEGITSVRVRLWGAGNRGGGGGFALKTINDLVPSASIPITVGVTAGATSSFGAYVSATGGTEYSTSNAGIGGTGIGGDINHSGGGNPKSSSGSNGCGGAGNLFGNGGYGGQASTFGVSGSSAASGGGGGEGTTGTVRTGGNGGSGFSGKGGMGGSYYAVNASQYAVIPPENGESSFGGIDFIGTGGGGGGIAYGSSGGAGANGGGGGSNGPGGFPGGGGAPHGIGLVIVEW